MVKIVKTKPSDGTHTDSRSQRVFQIARKVSATIGAEFFQAIAKHLTRLLAADCVLIGEFVGRKMEGVRTLGAYMDGQSVSFEYEVAGSASATLVFGKPSQCRSEAQTRFPSDRLISAVRAQALLGLPLLDPQGRAIGLIMVLYRHTMVSFTVAREMLQFFSDRAAAELNRKREEDELRETDERYRAFIAKNADAMWRVEFEQPIDISLNVEDQIDKMYSYGYVAECNDATARLMGLQRAEQVIGSRLEQIAPKTDPDIREATLASIRNGYEFTTVELERQSGVGNWRHLLRSQWGIVEDGKLERIWGTTRDITELKHSEQALDASEQRMADLLETMQLAVLIEDPAGMITHCNRHFHQMTKWRMRDITGRPWVDLMVPPEERRKLRTIFEGARSRPEIPVHFEGTLLGPEGQRWQFDWDRTALRDSEGQIVAWANLGRDVTKHKALEGQLRQAQKLATIGKLTGALAHDFNHLLTVILGYSTRLLEDWDRLDPGSFSALDEIRKAATKGAELTNRLLAFGRQQALRPEVLNLNALIQDCEQMLQRLVGEQIVFNTALDHAAGLVRIDASSFHQVLMNLVVNARDAMPESGTLTIATSNKSVDEGEVPAAPAGEYVLLTISDTGKGMTPEVRDHIFEPFFTTKDQGRGTGLGLSTVYGIVQQSGGNILVDSQPEKGSTFRIYLPRINGELKKEQSKQTASAMPAGSETILLVEDREDVRELTARTLEELGYTVLEAEDSASALKFLRDRGEHIDLLLTDVAMPGINGFELADLIRTYQSGIKVLFISGYSDPEHFAGKLTDPDCAYLAKPFTPHALATLTRDLLNRK
jgi:two-component system, cell cycle sensor histidine kinase and response regulator CckA